MSKRNTCLEGLDSYLTSGSLLLSKFEFRYYCPANWATFIEYECDFSTLRPPKSNIWKLLALNGVIMVIGQGRRTGNYSHAFAAITY